MSLALALSATGMCSWCFGARLIGKVQSKRIFDAILACAHMCVCMNAMLFEE